MFRRLSENLRLGWWQVILYGVVIYFISQVAGWQWLILILLPIRLLFSAGMFCLEHVEDQDLEHDDGIGIEVVGFRSRFLILGAIVVMGPFYFLASKSEHPYLSSLAVAFVVLWWAAEVIGYYHKKRIIRRLQIKWVIRQISGLIRKLIKSIEQEEAGNMDEAIEFYVGIVRLRGETAEQTASRVLDMRGMWKILTEFASPEVATPMRIRLQRLRYN